MRRAASGSRDSWMLRRILSRFLPIVPLCGQGGGLVPSVGGPIRHRSPSSPLLVPWGIMGEWSPPPPPWLPPAWVSCSSSCDVALAHTEMRSSTSGVIRVRGSRDRSRGSLVRRTCWARCTSNDRGLCWVGGISTCRCASGGGWNGGGTGWGGPSSSSTLCSRSRRGYEEVRRRVLLLLPAGHPELRDCRRSLLAIAKAWRCASSPVTGLSGSTEEGVSVWGGWPRGPPSPLWDIWSWCNWNNRKHLVIVSRWLISLHNDIGIGIPPPQAKFGGRGTSKRRQGSKPAATNCSRPAYLP